MVAVSSASAGTSPTGGSTNKNNALLGLRRLYAGGAKTLELHPSACPYIILPPAGRKNGDRARSGLGSC
jgi:hypothetical protein